MNARMLLPFSIAFACKPGVRNRNCNHEFYNSACGGAKVDSSCNMLHCKPCGAIIVPQSSKSSKYTRVYLHVLLHAPPLQGDVIVTGLLKHSHHSLVLLELLTVNYFVSMKYSLLRPLLKLCCQTSTSLFALQTIDQHDNESSTVSEGPMRQTRFRARPCLSHPVEALHKTFEI